MTNRKPSSPRRGGEPDERPQETWSSGRGVLDGAFRLLQALPQSGREHQHSELARITGIPRSSVYRLMSQLEAVGAVERLADGHYVPAPLLSDIARHADPHAALRAQGLQIMHALRSRTGATVSLVVPTAHGSKALEVVPGGVTLPTPIYAGIAMPRTSAAALIFDPSAAPERANPVDGWAHDDARVHAGLTCYASAIRVAGRTEAALQISTPADRPSSRFAVLIRRAAERVAQQLSAASNS
ncbi:helix-turn-helix domain-containing protein [Mycobacterium parascrofulaceum]|uniref:helix-turn-helix domain-containing protein n=1 Tax=Mycobacterium parascrofulaceum TaxID=240125 RepID=UPI0009F523CC|nr:MULTISPECIES: helix-turn-helix domain-containing protein [Mycobacterium]